MDWRTAPGAWEINRAWAGDFPGPFCMGGCDGEISVSVDLRDIP